VNISSYEDLLNAANAQADPQRMLFVFAEAELPDEHSKNQLERYKARKGGTLTPVICVDKLASEQCSFAGLVEESRQTGKNWDIVFVACMDAKHKPAHGNDETEQTLKSMVKSIQGGSIGNYLAFNQQGELIRLVAS